MTKIIIENRSSIRDVHCLSLVMQVMEQGRVSNDGKQYCFLSCFSSGDYAVQVSTDLNKCSDRFVIVDD